MKLLRSVILSLVLVMIGSSAVFADGTEEYKIQEIGVTIQAPDSLLAYTRTSGIEESVINALGYTSDDYQEYLIGKMKDENNYFIGFDANVDYQVSLKSMETNLASFSSKTDEEILQLVDEGLDGELTQYGVEVSAKSVFTENDRKYAVVDLSDDTGYCQLYAIVESGQAYYFYVRSYASPINDAQKALVKQIAGSAQFYEKVELDEEAMNQLGGEVESDADEGIDIISEIVDIAKIVIVLALALIALILIVSRLTRTKLGIRKSKSKGANYSMRRDVVYEDRLRRVMEEKKKEVPVEAPLPDEDLYL